jgi:hypothetical protein
MRNRTELRLALGFRGRPDPVESHQNYVIAVHGHRKIVRTFFPTRTKRYPTHTNSLFALLGMGLHQPLGHDQKSEDLRPLGDDVANHLSPF